MLMQTPTPGEVYCIDRCVCVAHIQYHVRTYIPCVDVKPVPSPVQASSWIEVSRQHRHALTHRKPTTMGLLGRQSKDGSSGIAHSTSESSALLLHGHGSSPPKQQNLSEDARDHTCVESTAPSTQMVYCMFLDQI